MIQGVLLFRGRSEYQALAILSNAQATAKRLANREHDARRRQEQPWRRWYFTARWRRIRQDQLSRQPLCERCQARGTLTPATVCHHVVAHKGDEHLFWSGPFASSCAPCHDIDEQRIERGGQARQTVGEDGWPV